MISPPCFLSLVSAAETCELVNTGASLTWMMQAPQIFLTISVRLQRHLDENEAGMTAVTQDLFEMESSARMSPQSVGLQGFGMVSVKVVENGKTWNQSSRFEISA